MVIDSSALIALLVNEPEALAIANDATRTFASWRTERVDNRSIYTYSQRT